MSFYKSLKNSLKLTHSLDKRKLPVLILYSLLSASMPFVAILLSAEILNRISAKSEFSPLLLFILVCISGMFVLTVLTSILKKKDLVINENCQRLYQLKKSEKAMTMDFVLLDSPSTNALRTTLRNEEAMGFGISFFFRIFDLFLTNSIMAVFASVYLVVFTARNVNISLINTLIFVVISLILSISVALFLKSCNKKSMDTVKNINTPWLVLSEHLLYENGITHKDGKDIRIYGFHSVIKGFMESSQRQLETAFSKVCLTIPALAYGANGFVKGLILGGSYLFVALEAQSGNLSIAMVVLLAGMLYQLSSSISEAIVMLSGLTSATDSLQKYIEYTTIPEEQYKGSLPVEKRSDNEYVIEFRNVSFKYPGSDNYSLKNLSLSLTIGKRLAIVGMNGSGKTTMIKLLCRLYDPTEGEILLNGINIQKYNLTEYSSLFSVVFQDFKLFSFELGQNIAVCTECDEKMAVIGLKKAGSSDKVFSRGLKTLLYKDFDDGDEISGGEAQKVALARALYKNAPFIILDEPTAALDPIAEHDIYSHMSDIVGQKTAVFISHRLSSCRFCHDIAVFHEGQLIERGSHNALLENADSRYSKLWSAQAQYYAPSSVG